MHVLRPLRKYHEENVKIITDELAYPGVSVIIPRRECVVAVDKRVREKLKSKQDA
jgi:indolepyruvate ferredoxin oxidoreductase alpha subunit